MVQPLAYPVPHQGVEERKIRPASTGGILGIELGHIVVWTFKWIGHGVLGWSVIAIGRMVEVR